mmetsp:Transcript_17945/g.31371  ORF Transcript_17945/g.31371 Transcript_17945/m.31371 type:complete len:85 (+) Transcript_17945:70-324(+)
MQQASKHNMKMDTRISAVQSSLHVLLSRRRANTTHLSHGANWYRSTQTSHAWLREALHQIVTWRGARRGRHKCIRRETALATDT